MELVTVLFDKFFLVFICTLEKLNLERSCGFYNATTVLHTSVQYVRHKLKGATDLIPMIKNYTLSFLSFAYIMPVGPETKTSLHLFYQ